jgi:uncharacterized protein YnzC (UPF0291/DUF896 family)
MIQDHEVARINELARKKKAEGLTPEEAAEQHALRRKYVEAVKSSLRAHLEHIRPADPDNR